MSSCPAGAGAACRASTARFPLPPPPRARLAAHTGAAGNAEGLREYGFGHAAVEEVLLLLVDKPVAGEALGLAACLDWLCLHVPNAELPAGLKEHKAKDGLKVGEVVAGGRRAGTPAESAESAEAKLRVGAPTTPTHRLRRESPQADACAAAGEG